MGTLFHILRDERDMNHDQKAAGWVDVGVEIRMCHAMKTNLEHRWTSLLGNSFQGLCIESPKIMASTFGP
jgi:hypothetical protein